MKILIAEDDPISRCAQEENLLEWGYEIMVAFGEGEKRNIIKGLEGRSG